MNGRRSNGTKQSYFAFAELDALYAKLFGLPEELCSISNPKDVICENSRERNIKILKKEIN